MGTNKRGCLTPEPTDCLAVSGKARFGDAAGPHPGGHRYFPIYLWPHTAWQHALPLPGGPAGSSLQLTGLQGLAGEPSGQPHGAHHGCAGCSQVAPTWCEHTLVSFCHLLLSLKNYISICFHTFVPSQPSFPEAYSTDPESHIGHCWPPGTWERLWDTPG